MKALFLRTPLLHVHYTIEKEISLPLTHEEAGDKGMEANDNVPQVCENSSVMDGWWSKAYANRERTSLQIVWETKIHSHMAGEQV